MDDAPKRVWMDPTSEDGDGMFIVAKDRIYGNMDVEYIHKSIADELAEALRVLFIAYAACNGIDNPAMDDASAALAKYKEAAQ